MQLQAQHVATPHQQHHPSTILDQDHEMSESKHPDETMIKKLNARLKLPATVFALINSVAVQLKKAVHSRRTAEFDEQTGIILRLLINLGAAIWILISGHLLTCTPLKE